MNRLSEYVSMLKGGDDSEIAAVAAHIGANPVATPQAAPPAIVPISSPITSQVPINQPLQLINTQSHMTQPVKESYIPYKRDSFVLYDKPDTYNIFIYKSMNGTDMYIGSTTAHLSHTIKQILNNFKVSGKVCIVSYETQIVTSLNHQDFDITLDLLHLQFPKIKLYIL